MDLIQRLLFDSEFSPHAVCLLWRPDLLLLHGGADALIALAYFTIPIVIVRATRVRPDLIDPRLAKLFAAFILTCGLSHVAGLATLWLPIYGIEGAIKMVTALVSLYTAYRLAVLFPQFVSLPSRAELARAEAQALMTEREARATKAENQRLADFAHTASHDLRAPLRNVTAISGFLREDLAERGVKDPEIDEHIDLMAGQIEQMENLTQDLLDYARSGSASGELEELDLREVVEKTVDLVLPPEGFHVATEGDLGGVHANRVEVELILRNLIGNAIKHHDREAGRIVIRALGLRDGHFRFEVEDDGPGIPGDAKERIFQPFTKLKTGRSAPGSGLGLATVKLALEARGGTISARSGADGRGAIFTVDLGQPAMAL